MTKITRAAIEQDAPSAGRQEYARPRLKDFGSVGALTQSGTAGKLEQMSGQGSMNQMA